MMKTYSLFLLALALGVTPCLASGPRPSESFADSSVQQQFERAKDYDVQHTRLELKVNMDNNSLRGTAAHTLSANREGLSSIVFDQNGITFNSITTDGGDELEWNVEGDSVRVALPAPLHLHEVVTVVIDYESSDRREGTYWITPTDEYPDRRPQLWTQGETRENRYWFPAYDNPNDFRTSETLVTVKKPFKVVSNGELVSVTDHGAEQTWAFRMETPHANYLQSLVIGDLDVFEETYDGIPIHSYYDPKFKEDAPRAFGRTDEMMRIFSEKTGVRYPYPAYSQTVVDEYLFGGMENVTATTLTERTMRDENAFQVGNSDALVAHELAHQWFGDYITCRNWANIWLNEGFATYMETVYFEAAYGRDRALWDVRNNQRGALRTDKRYHRPLTTRYYESEDDMFDGISYSKGGCVLHMLRHRLGDDQFWAAINKYITDNGPGNVVSEDLRVAAYEVSGQPLDHFFDQWVYRAGHPSFEVSWKWINESSLVKVSIKQTQEVSELQPLFTVPIDLDFTGDDWHQTHRIWISEDHDTFYFQALERPLMVEFDRDRWILKEMVFEKPTKELIYQLEHSPSVLSRDWAAEQLPEKNNSKSIEALSRCLQNVEEFYGVREEAAAALGKVGTHEAFLALKDGLDLKDPRVRTSITEALSEFFTEDAESVLKRAVQSDPSYSVVSAAIQSTGKAAGKQVLGIIQLGLAKESFRDQIRRSSLSALADLEDPKNLPLVYPFAGAGIYYETRETALEALGRLGGELDKKDNQRKKVRKELERSIQSSVIQVQLSAVAGLKSLGEADAIPALQRIAKSPQHSEVIRRAKETIRSLRADPDREENKQRAVLERLDDLEKKNRNLEEDVKELRGRLNTSDETSP